jgi:hypothetical protein
MKYLAEDCKQSQYATNVYIVPGPAASQLSRLSKEQVERGNGQRVMCSFRRELNKKKSTGNTAHEERVGRRQDATQGRQQGWPRRQMDESEDDGDDEALDGGNGDLNYDSGRGYGISGDAGTWQPSANITLAKRTLTDRDRREVSESDADEDLDDWKYSMRAGTSGHKRPRRSGERPPKTVVEGDIEFMVLSSD